MMRPDAKVEKVYLYPKPVDFRISIDGLAAMIELNIKVAVFDPVLFVFLIGNATASALGSSAWNPSDSKHHLMPLTRRPPALIRPQV